MSAVGQRSAIGGKANQMSAQEDDCGQSVSSKEGDEGDSAENVQSPADTERDDESWTAREMEEAEPFPLPEVPEEGEPDRGGPAQDK